MRKEDVYKFRFDTPAEGCYNNNSDLFCDSPYNITNSSGGIVDKDYFSFVVKDGWLLGLQITDVIPIQVIKDVDMVKGKRTLIRVPVIFTGNSSNSTINVSLKLMWNTTIINQTTKILNSSQVFNWDNWYIPNISGANIPVKAEVNGTHQGFNLSDMKTKSVDVVETISQFNITYVPVLIQSQLLMDNVNRRNSDYFLRTHPLADNALNNKTKNSPITGSQSTFNLLKIAQTLQQVYEASVIDGQFPHRAVGVVPEGWLQSLQPFGRPATGIALGGKYYPAVLTEATASGNPYRTIVAHELGHTFGLCDEYATFDWNIQNLLFLGCPNGDLDNNGSLDGICLENPLGSGCPTSSLEPITGLSDSQPFVNFMGSVENESDQWIDNATYNHLLSEFEPQTFEFHQRRILLTGFILETAIQKVYIIENFFTLGAGFVTNTLNLFGNFSILVKDNLGNTVQNFSFEPSFLLVLDDGNTTTINQTPFSFVIPYNENITQFIFNGTNSTQKIVNVTVNKPNITIISPNNFTVFSNKLFNITWNATDMDGDNLSFIIQVSPNNGTTYTTFALNHNESFFSINSSLLQDSNQYRVRVLVSDGVNTNNDTNDNPFEIDNDLNITKFNIIYTNETQRIYRIDVNNTLNMQIQNLNWTLKTGNITKSSSIVFSLNPSEQIFFYLYHNYSISGVFNVTFTVFNDDYLEYETIQVSI